MTDCLKSGFYGYFTQMRPILILKGSSGAVQLFTEQSFTRVVCVLGPYSQHFFFFVTYEWAQ